MSKFSIALKNLGFRNKPYQDQNLSNLNIQKAIVSNVYFAGYFKEKIIWQAINLINYNKLQKQNCIWGKNSQSAFLLLQKILKNSGALQDNLNFFKSEYLLENLFSEDVFDIEDIEDFIVYLVCQNAFARIANQERNEIAYQSWTKTYKNQYLENAQKIGLIEEKKPLFLEYDEAWVMGCARSGAVNRINYLKQVIDSGISIKNISLLSGNRELWVEIDNIGNIAEAKDFIIKLANKNNIKIDNQKPFVQRKVSGKTRTYLNYQNNENRKVTETMMMKEIYNHIFGISNNVTIIDDIANVYRPTTESTVENITKNIFKKRFTKNGDLNDKLTVKIMIVSNQPYCKRQKLTTKRVVDKILNHKISKKIIFDDVGNSAINASIATIHSEFAALISEQFWQYIKSTSHLKKRKRLPHKMIFSTKHKDISFIPTIPIC